MPTNEVRRDLLNQIRASGYPGSITEVFQAADQGIDLVGQFVQQQEKQQMQVAQTPQQQEVGLREEHARGNTQASMAFPDVQPGQSFNTVGMKAPIDIQKIDDQGHLVESYENVPPGIQDLPTGPYEGTVIESPAAYQKGGMKGMMKSKIAYESHFGNNPAINRMLAPTDEPYEFSPGKTGTHFMGSHGEYAIPHIQDVGGKLKLTGPRRDEAIKFHGPRAVEDATYFAEHYKDVAPAFQKQKGGKDTYQLGGKAENIGAFMGLSSKGTKAQLNPSINILGDCRGGGCWALSDKALRVGPVFEAENITGLKIPKFGQPTYSDDPSKSIGGKTYTGGQLTYESTRDRGRGYWDYGHFGAGVKGGVTSNKKPFYEGTIKYGRLGDPGIGKYQFGVYGKYGSPEAESPGTTIGGYGRFGVLSGQAGYNLKTGRPDFRVGLGYNFQKGGVRNINRIIQDFKTLSPESEGKLNNRLLHEDTKTYLHSGLGGLGENLMRKIKHSYADVKHYYDAYVKGNKKKLEEIKKYRQNNPVPNWLLRAPLAAAMLSPLKAGRSSTVVDPETGINKYTGKKEFTPFQKGGYKDEWLKMMENPKDNIIYPPPDEEVRFEPYNEDILDIRSKLKNPNVTNEDLQKQFYYEKWRDEQNKKRDSGAFQKGGRYQDGGLRNHMMNYLHDTGRDTNQVNLVMDAIGQHESKNKYKQKQISQTDEGTFYDGPGRGTFQFEVGPEAGGNTAINRTANFLKHNTDKNIRDFPYLFKLYNDDNSLDFSKLSKKDQEGLFIGDKIFGGIIRRNEFDALTRNRNTPPSQEEIFMYWLRNHKGKVNGKDVIIETRDSNNKILSRDLNPDLTTEEIEIERNKWNNRTKSIFKKRKGGYKKSYRPKYI